MNGSQIASLLVGCYVLIQFARFFWWMHQNQKEARRWETPYRPRL